VKLITEDVLALVRDTIRRHAMFAGGDVVLVAVSGGADSTALLYLMSALAPEWDLRLHALHVDHGLREDSAADAGFVRDLGCDRVRSPGDLGCCRRRHESDLGVRADEEPEVGRLDIADHRAGVVGDRNAAERLHGTTDGGGGSVGSRALDEDEGNVEEAVRHYRRALGLSPDYADAHFNLAAALARSGRPAEAVSHWQRYLELDGGSPWARIARAHLEIVESPDA